MSIAFTPSSRSISSRIGSVNGSAPMTARETGSSVTSMPRSSAASARYRQ